MGALVQFRLLYKNGSWFQYLLQPKKRQIRKTDTIEYPSKPQTNTRNNVPNSGRTNVNSTSHQSQNERHKSTTSLYRSEYGVLNLDTPSHISDHRINTDENTLVFKVEYEKRDNGFFPMSTWVKKDDLLRQSPRIYANYLDIHLEYAI